jgi:hypothetical protein
MFTLNSFGQTIQELEYDLSWHHISEKHGSKIEIAKKLQKLDPFNYKAADYIFSYYKLRDIDSVSIYFDNLINKFQDKTEPYILRCNLLFHELDYRDKDKYTSQKIKYLKQALAINSNDPTIIFMLAEVYYKDFVFPLQKEKNQEFNIDFVENLIDSTKIFKEKHIKKSTFEFAADSSLNYFYKYWKLSQDKKEIIYFPIRQIECFLNKIAISPIQLDYEKKFNQCYFPASYFTNLPQNWECNFTTDYLYEVESGKRTAEWLELYLNDLNENCLYTREIMQNSVIYRFTWLRTFHHPVSIRIEKIENDIMLYWKIGNGMGGYKPKGLKKEGKKELSVKEWIKFEELIKEANFESLPNKSYKKHGRWSCMDFRKEDAQII